MKFYLGPYIQIDNGDGPAMSPPIASVGSIDLGGSARNIGVFVLPNSETLGSQFRQIGQAPSPDSISIGLAARQQWQAVFGLASTPIASTLTELIRETLMEHADGAGISHVRPLVPGHDGKMKLFLFDRQIWESDYNGANQDPRYAQSLLRQLRDIYSSKRSSNLLEQDDFRRRHYLRWLAVQAMKYKLDRAGWRAIQGDNPEEELVNPATTYTESFPTNGALTSGQDQTWSLYAAGTYDVNANQIRALGGGHYQALMTSPLSSDDQYCQIVKTFGGDTLSVGPNCRNSGATYSGYYALRYGTSFYLRWWLNHTIDTSSGGTQSLPETIRVEADGSSISHYKNGGLLNSVTDTNVASGSYCGVYTFDVAGHGDDWEAGDLGAAPTYYSDELMTLGVGS